MALVLADRVLETTTSTGSGTITLAGAEPGYQSFAVIGNGNETYYTIAGDTEWEVGIGTYTSSGTTLSRDTVLSSSDSGNKVTFSAGVKKVFVTYPSEKSVNFGVSGNISVSSGVITDVGYPSADSDAATKLYVDNMTSAALHIHEAVVLTTPADSGRNDNYNNGTAGVSATLTATANGTLVIDSTVAQSAQRVLIKDCDDQAENGIYVVTTVGTASTPYVMTRASDADTSGEQTSTSLDEGSYFFTTGGTSQKGAAYVCNTPGVIVFGSTAITFAEFSQAQVYSAGNGISITLGSIALNTPVTVASGGTGLTTSPTNGQLLIGNGSNYTLSTLTAGSGVSITNSAGSITLSATGLGGTVTAVTATGPLASSGGTTPDISIANSTGTGSVVLDQGATISSATITAAVSASITTITGTSANITTVTGTTAGFSSANITQLGTTSATIATLSGTNVTYSSGTVSQLAATSATIASVSGTNVTYSNGNLTSATITTVSGTTATYTSATVTNLALTSLTLSNLSIASATITTGNLGVGGTAQGNIKVHALGDFPILGGNANSTAFGATGTVPTSITSTARGFYTSLTTAASFTLSNAIHFQASNVNVGAGSTVTNQFGFLAGSGLNTATNNYGFYGEIASGSNRYNVYMAGTADNYFAGNVGIGTTTVSYKLTQQQASDSTFQRAYVIRDGDQTNFWRLSLGRNYTSTTSGVPANAAFLVTELGGGYGADGGLALGTLNAQPLVSVTNGTERMRIDSSGNVGIGTASPNQKLVVGGNVYCNTGNFIANRGSGGANTSGSGVELQIDGTTYAAIRQPAAETLAFYRGSGGTTETMRITSAGNVGIGATSPSTKLHVYGAGTTSANYTNGDATGPTLYLQDSNGSSGNGGQLLFGAAQGIFAGIKGFIVDGTGPAGVLIFQTRTTSGNVNERARIGYGGGLAVGTTAEPGSGAIIATGNITAYYSDARLKDFKGKIGGALYKVSQLNGYYYTENEKAEEFGYNNKELQVGVSAQEVQAVLPEVVTAAPFDLNENNESKSGENYMTVRYEKLVPLLIEAIKELKAEVEALKAGK